MKYVKFVLMGFGVIAAALLLSENILSAGGQGIFTLAMCLAPVVLAAWTLVGRHGMPRWASGVSLVAFLIAVMKTTEAPLDNAMMAAAAGILCALALLIKPDGPGRRMRSGESWTS